MTQKTQITAETEALAKRRKAKLAAALKANLVRRKAGKTSATMQNNAPDTENKNTSQAPFPLHKKDG